MSITSDQIDELVRAIAVKLGLNADAPNVMDLVLDYPVDQVPTSRGLFTDVYAAVTSWISDTDQDGNLVPEEGIDKSAWTFLRAAANVNFGDTLDAFMAREYTGIQYNLRIGELSGEALDQKIYQMSNGIALNIMKQIVLNARNRGRSTRARQPDRRATSWTLPITAGSSTCR